MTTIGNEDPLIAEIEKMIAKEENPEYRNDCKEDVLDYLRVFHKLVIADRARQQAEKEKMIAELKEKESEYNLAYKLEQDGELKQNYLGRKLTYGHAVHIIQGKEQKEEREASK